MDEELKAEFAAVHEHIEKRAKQTETTILQAFQNWSKRLASRQRMQGATLNELDERIVNVEDRLDDIEHPELSQ